MRPVDLVEQFFISQRKRSGPIIRSIKIQKWNFCILSWPPTVGVKITCQFSHHNTICSSTVQQFVNAIEFVFFSMKEAFFF